MGRYRVPLPQLAGGLYLTDGGLETTLVFHERIELPCFAAFPLVAEEPGRSLLRSYYRRYLDLAVAYGLGFVLEAPTWRANPDWARRLGYGSETLASMNREAVALMNELRDAYRSHGAPIVISGCIGPRGVGYDAGEPMTADAACDYHAIQVSVLAETEADMLTAMTITSSAEAIGIAEIARAAAMPIVISFTVEADGCLPTGEPVGAAIRAVDCATRQTPAYYMINCAHPSHLAGALESGGDWLCRLRGIRANASCRSHAELNSAVELDEGHPLELGRQFRDLRRRYPQLTVLGGCCGTDHRHVEAIAHACTLARAA